MKKDIKIYLIKEGLIQSIVADVISFSFPFTMLFLNATYWGNSWIIQIFTCLLFFIFISSKGKEKVKTFYSEKELIEYLQKKESNNGK